MSPSASRAQALDPTGGSRRASAMDRVRGHRAPCRAARGAGDVHDGPGRPPRNARSFWRSSCGSRPRTACARLRVLRPGRLALRSTTSRRRSCTAGWRRSARPAWWRWVWATTSTLRNRTTPLDPWLERLWNALTLDDANAASERSPDLKGKGRFSSRARTTTPDAAEARLIRRRHA